MAKKKRNITKNTTNKKKTSAKKRKVKPGIRYLSFAVVGVLVAGLLFMLLGGSGFTEGIAYLEAQSNKEMEELAEKINTDKMNRMIASIDAGNSSIFDFFADSVLLGDSRMYGFGSYGFLPEDRVMAEAGYTIANISEFTDQVKQFQPQYIYLSYGVNDMGLGIGADRGEDGYGQVYEEQINKLLEVSPNSTIVINSIIPPTPGVVESNPTWNQSEEFNEQIKAICEKNGWIYVDNDPLAQGGTADIYAGDGIHFLAGVYPVWATNMYEAVMENR